MPTIFDLVKSQELTAYWETYTKDMPPYLGEELFPADKKLGLDLKWIKGASGLPAVLKPSAFDSKSIARDRIGFDKLSAEMPFFKESMYVDENLRQELNKVLETNNAAYIDAVLNRVFADEATLISGARAQRERMRMSALTTGAISISANGQVYSYDYGVPSDHKDTVTTSWSNTAADIMGDIYDWQQVILDGTGVKPTRAICDNKTWGYIKSNEAIKKSIFVLSNGQATVSDAKLKEYLLQELELEVVVYTKRYKDETGTAKAFVPADTFVLFPEGQLGTTWFGTTPEESDLLSTNVANVSITDTGVAVTTTKETDPVNVNTKVTMICLPSFETADQIFIADVIA